MIAGSKLLRKFISEGMITPIPDNPSLNVEANVLDLTLGRVMCQKDQAMHRREFGRRATRIDRPYYGRRRCVPEPSLCHPSITDQNSCPTWRLEPGYAYILETREIIAIPTGWHGELVSRKSHLCGGLFLDKASVPCFFQGRGADPDEILTKGFRGKLQLAGHIPLYGPPVTLEYGDHFCGIILRPVIESEFGIMLAELLCDLKNSDFYDGIWGGSKVATDGFERGF